MVASRAEPAWRERIALRLLGTAPAADPEAEARAGLLPGTDGAFPWPLTRAAVLVPLLERPGGHVVVLTRRADHLPDHPGQISLPGGRIDPDDAGPLAAALREFREEIGGDPAQVAIAGYLPPLPVVTGFVVTPVVGFIERHAAFIPDPAEVAEVFEVPLAFLLDPANVRCGHRQVRGIELPVAEFVYGRWRIWGATAQILQSLIKNIL